ncbi:glutathione S-transferase family protein [Yoonia sp. GPGPB17]|uniref:glutathione S-transferase family protein n=1 Tax=Yoonia sp. GPGPB17 TaxID=3026147 RepID=UPI0030C3D898
MEKTLRLYYAPDNASLCVRLALEELSLPYDTVLVDRSVAAHKSEAYLALNPNGLIPVLDTPHGPLFETGAILMWLAETQDRLMPKQGTLDRMHALQWMIWLANTLHPSLRMMFYPTQYADDDPGPTRKMAATRVKSQMDLLCAAQTVDWLEDDHPSIHACYLAPMLRWAALYGGGDQWFDLNHWPRLYAFAKRFEARDSARKAAAAEGLGATPFSHPSPCHPPEGSAL